MERQDVKAPLVSCTSVKNKEKQRWLTGCNFDWHSAGVMRFVRHRGQRGGK